MSGTRNSSLLGKITVFVVICCCSLSAQAKYGGGTGEPNDPYLIFDANQMNAIGADANDWDKHFILMADINLSGYTGTDFHIIGNDANEFTGVFDGNDHTISNFTYTSTGTNYIALFGYVGSGGEIKNLGLLNVNIDAGMVNRVGGLVGYSDGTVSNCYATGTVSGGWTVGGLVGYNCRGTVSNCCATGTVTGDGTVGSLVGFNWDGTISNCYATGTVTGGDCVGGLVGLSEYGGTISNCYATGTVTGDWSVGGLVGWNEYGGTISNCYARGNVTGTSSVGGLVGFNYGTVSNCYSTGNVRGDGYVGGLVGENGDTILASFWDTQTCGQSNGIGDGLSGGVTGKTTAEMKTQSTFTDAAWDFLTPVWTINEGVDYPRLWWEISPLLHAEPEVTLGTSNTISWDPVTGANDYYAECAEDTNFTSIIYNTGWITETSYTFTGLEVGQVYWYSVKARNIAGTESGWSNVESSLQVMLADAVDMMLDPDTLKNKNMKNALLNKINAVQQMIADGFYADALNKLQNDILQKTDGCAETGRPDKNDWIITCEEQNQIYPLVMETIENVKGLMD